MFIHKTKVQVLFGDTDPYGVVYFVAYFRYFHQGIEEFLRHIGISPKTFFRNQEEKFGMPKVAADCRFFIPAHYGDTLGKGHCFSVSILSPSGDSAGCRRERHFCGHRPYLEGHTPAENHSRENRGTLGGSF